MESDNNKKEVTPGIKKSWIVESLSDNKKIFNKTETTSESSVSKKQPTPTPKEKPVIENPIAEKPVVETAKEKPAVAKTFKVTTNKVQKTVYSNKVLLKNVSGQTQQLISATGAHLALTPGQSVEMDKKDISENIQRLCSTGKLGSYLF